MSNKRKEDSILSYFQKKIKPLPESNVPLPQRDTDVAVENDCDQYDIGHYIKNNLNINEDFKYKLLKNPLVPSIHYNFKKDIVVGNRAILFKWFSIYPWLAYSKIFKGTFCLYCVLFQTHVSHGGFQGQFINKPFQRYQKFLEKANNHSKTQWHIESSIRFNDFINMTSENSSVHQMINTNYKNKIDANRKKLIPILSSLYFCALHNLPIRGKTDDSAVFNKLLQFRIDAGDNILKDHLENAPKNLTYISHRTQNEMLESMSATLKSVISQEINEASCFSIIADETADISGIEQLSICIRFLKHNNLHEEFIGFYPLKEFDAEFISKTILEACNHMKLDLNKCVGQGYDGCATMAGCISGVQKDMYPRAHFFHCASHRLNLVINDLNVLPEVRNCITKIKDTITFFKESAVRMNVINSSNCKLTRLCETRFVEKHKSVRQFNEKFIVIVEGLEEMSTSKHFNSKTKQGSLEILNAITTPNFIILLSIIAKYSAKFEFISTILQGVNIDLQEATKRIQELLQIVKSDRCNSECQFNLIFKKAEETAIKIGLELKIPRRAIRQTQRDNYPSNNINDFFRQSLFIPYLDSIIMSISDRFSDENVKSFSLFNLHPKIMIKMNIEEFSEVVKSINSLYGPLLDNFEEEAITWYEMWLKKTCDPNTEIIDLLEESKYYPAVNTALQIAITLPATSCSVERTFSALRRIKTWGEYAKKFYTGIFLDALDFDDYECNCECGKYPVTNIAIDGWTESPFKDCPALNKN
ncbi:hypothetical protein QTP88_004543 [Uroleucon formosanum]